jgi:hypothetical protein
MMANWAGWRRVLAAVVGVAALVAALSAIVPLARAESFSVTSSPAGAAVEIDGAVVSTTPFRVDYPGGYFHMTHVVFSARLEHRMGLRVSKDGYVLREITLTDGPFDWIGVTGKHHGKYYLLRADHYELKLEAVAVARESGVGRVGPIHPHGTELREEGATGETGNVAIASDPVGAEIYPDAIDNSAPCGDASCGSEGGGKDALGAGFDGGAGGAGEFEGGFGNALRGGNWGARGIGRRREDQRFTTEVTEKKDEGAENFGVT